MTLNVEHFVVDKGGGSSGLKDIALIKQMWPFVSPHRRLIVGALLLLLPATATQVLLPLVVKRALDGPIQHHDWSGLLLMVGAYILLMVLHYGCKRQLMIWSQLAGQHIIYDVQTALYRHLQTLSRDFYHKTPIGKLVTRITNDVDNLSEMFSSGAISILLDAAVVVGVVVAMLVQQWQLAVVVCVMLAAIMTVIELLRRKVREKTDDIRVKVAAMNAYLQENFTGMDVVQLNRREAQNLSDFKALNNSNLRSNLRQVFYECSLSAAVEFLSTITLTLIIAISGVALGSSLGIIPGHFWTVSGLSFGLLVAFFIYVQMIFSPIEDLAEKYVIVQSGLASIDKIVALLKEPKQSVYEHHPYEGKAHPLQGKITFDDVSFGYQPQRLVLNKVSFTIAPGQTAAIVGPTGSGKTTIIKLLMGFYTPSAGQIWMDDQPYTDWNVFTLRRQMVIIQQDDVIFSRSVAENITLDPDEACDLNKQQAIVEALTTVNFGGVLDRFVANVAWVLEEQGRNLSAGEKQLLLFARAVYHNPAILVLDEATSAIDPHTEVYVQQAMEKVMAGRTTIVIAHRLSTIEKADQILVLKDGLVAEQGTHGGLMASGGLYAQFQRYSVQTQGVH